ncbi:hypothetical protein Ahy_A03g011418 [Arachis hypogaea]|uniref:Uncharacterized protein n=1 Tax=Arachis hypogaea TaxID=3818 RepID=A0A445DQP5_ARAHY|nr:hypothetical protein Ahy_A03g011418 [Arachis hypogaea]
MSYDFDVTLDDFESQVFSGFEIARSSRNGILCINATHNGDIEDLLEISIFINVVELEEYLGEYEGDPEVDYDMEDEEAFSFILIEDESGYFLRPTEKQMSHLRPLHITTTLIRIEVNKVLIDGRAAISLLPERMLMKVGKHPDDLVPTNIAVTNFSGTSTPTKGLVTLTVKSVLLWTEDGKPEIVKADSNLYVEQLHVDFRMYNPKLKPMNVDRTLNSYNCEGSYLSSEGFLVKLRYRELGFALTDWDCLS